MFGFGKKSGAEKEREAALERGKQIVREFVQKIAGATPEEAERKAQQLRDWCGAEDTLRLTGISPDTPSRQTLNK